MWKARSSGVTSNMSVYDDSSLFELSTSFKKEHEDKLKENREYSQKIDGFILEFCQTDLSDEVERAMQELVGAGVVLDVAMCPEDEDIDSEPLQYAVKKLGGNFINIDNEVAQDAKHVFRELMYIAYLLEGTQKQHQAFVWDDSATCANPTDRRSRTRVGGRIVITVPIRPDEAPDKTLLNAVLEMKQEVDDLVIAAGVMMA